MAEQVKFLGSLFTSFVAVLPAFPHHSFTTHLSGLEYPLCCTLIGSTISTFLVQTILCSKLHFQEITKLNPSEQWSSETVQRNMCKIIITMFGRCALLTLQKAKINLSVESRICVIYCWKERNDVMVFGILYSKEWNPLYRRTIIGIVHVRFQRLMGRLMFKFSLPNLQVRWSLTGHLITVSHSFVILECYK